MQLGTREPAHWISGAVEHPGALHRALHIPLGQRVPAKKIAAAEQSDSPRLRRMAQLAETLKGFHHGGR